MSNLSQRFNNLSLYKKILLILSTTLLFVFFAFVVGIQLLSQYYARELYTSNAQSLNYVSSFVSARMETVESGSARILSDTIIQTNLTDIMDAPTSIRNAQRKQTIYQALYPYIFDDDYIKSISLVLPDDTLICMGNTSDLDAFPLEELAENAAACQGRASWSAPASPGNTIVLYRDIRQLRHLTLDHLAYLYIVIDLDQLISDALENAGYSLSTHSRFILFAGNAQFYPQETYHPEQYSSLLQSLNHGSSHYSILSIDKRKTFVIQGDFPRTGWNYLYFQDYDPLFSAIHTVLIRMILFSAVVVMIALFLALLLLRRILHHLDLLVEKIRRFGQGLPDPEDTAHYDYSLRTDEIGQLHVSFDEMKSNVKTLRDKNYEKQLLLRDTNIKMLQQQINPHFLFNSLNAAAQLAMMEGAENTCLFVQNMADFFRYNVRKMEKDTTLKEELELVDNYIYILNVRFAGEIHYTKQIDERVTGTMMPSMILQPLIENAVNHGIRELQGEGKIHLSVYSDDSMVCVKVEDNGVGIEPEVIEKIMRGESAHSHSQRDSAGIGMDNVINRLKRYYNMEHVIEIRRREERGTEVVIYLKREDIR